MFESLSQRTVIIGNSGAGKSALAESLAASIHVLVIDLDLLNWEGNGYGRKRDEDAARRMTLQVSTQPLWIIEGVYGWLADVALPRATALIWLDFPWSLCRAGLLARSPRRGATNQDDVELLKWAETYWNRQTPSSFAGHLRMFANFPGTKFRLPRSFFSSDGFVGGTDEAANCGGQYKSPGLNGNKAGASIFGRAARYTRNSSGRYALDGVEIIADEALRSAP
jgi:hypothetical protein